MSRGLPLGAGLAETVERARRRLLGQRLLRVGSVGLLGASPAAGAIAAGLLPWLPPGWALLLLLGGVGGGLLVGLRRGPSARLAARRLDDELELEGRLLTGWERQQAGDRRPIVQLLLADAELWLTRHLQQRQERREPPPLPWRLPWRSWSVATLLLAAPFGLVPWLATPGRPALAAAAADGEATQRPAARPRAGLAAPPLPGGADPAQPPPRQPPTGPGAPQAGAPTVDGAPTAGTAANPGTPDAAAAAAAAAAAKGEGSPSSGAPPAAGRSPGGDGASLATAPPQLPGGEREEERSASPGPTPPGPPLTLERTAGGQVRGGPPAAPPATTGGRIPNGALLVAPGTRLGGGPRSLPLRYTAVVERYLGAPAGDEAAAPPATSTTDRPGQIAESRQETGE